MKSKLLTLFLALSIFLSLIAPTAYAATEMVTMYALDGRTTTIPTSDVELYKKRGWYTTHVIAMYNTKAEQVIVPWSDIELYQNNGWFTETDIPIINKETGQRTTVSVGNLNKCLEHYYIDVYVQVYSSDGRSLRIFQSYLPNYTQVGWFTSPPITMYAPDGRTIQVLPSDVEAYKNVGWYLEPVTAMYAPGNRSIVVPKKEAEAYKNVGWYSEPLVTLYTLDGRTADVPKADVHAWLEVGWYYADDYVTMYAYDGRETSVKVADIQAYKKVGWHMDRKKSVKTLKREAWEYAIRDIRDRLYVPNSGQFPTYDVNDVIKSGNTYYVYVDYTAKNRLGVRVRGYLLYTLILSSSGFFVSSCEDLLY